MKKRNVLIRFTTSISEVTPGFEKLFGELQAIENAHSQSSKSECENAKKKHLMRIFLDYSLGIGQFSTHIAASENALKPMNAPDLALARTPTTPPVHQAVISEVDASPASAEEITRRTREGAADLGIEFI